MDIPSGGLLGLVRVLLKPILDFFGKLIFYRAYELSTFHHNHREVFGRPWVLAEGLEFKLIWTPYHLRKRLVTPMIWLKAKDGYLFSKGTLVITASNNKVRYQNQITIFDVNEIPIKVALPSIPFRSIKIDGSRVLTPYDDIEVKVLELFDKQDMRINFPPSSAVRISPMDRLEVTMGLERGDIEKWEELFHLGYIESQIREERIRLIGSRWDSLKPIYFLKRKLLGMHWVAKTSFWAKNIFFAKQLEAELDKYIEEFEEQKKWEQNNLL